MVSWVGITLVAKDETFADVLVDEQLDSPEWRMERPKSRVFFRVQVIDVDGFRGAWSLPQRIDPPPLPWYIQILPVAIILLLAI